MSKGFLSIFNRTGRTARRFEAAKAFAIANPGQEVYFVLKNQSDIDYWTKKLKGSTVVKLINYGDAITQGLITKNVEFPASGKRVYVDHAVVENLLEHQLSLLFETTGEFVKVDNINQTQSQST